VKQGLFFDWVHGKGCHMAIKGYAVLVPAYTANTAWYFAVMGTKNATNTGFGFADEKTALPLHLT